MAARVVMSLSNSCTDFIATPLQQEIISLQHNLKFFIFVGGVSAMHHLPTDFTPLGVPTLHIMGANDPFIEQSRKLTTFFDSHTSTLLNHGEGHNIPSLRTGVTTLPLAYYLTYNLLLHNLSSPSSHNPCAHSNAYCALTRQYSSVSSY